jgi:hypothetical protein
MRIERSEKRALEHELIARPSSNKDVGLKNQKCPVLLHGRIEAGPAHGALEERAQKREKPRDGVRRIGRLSFLVTYVVTTLTAMIGWLWLLSKVVLGIVELAISWIGGALIGVAA